MHLYKDRYIIAVYDQEDRLIDVGADIAEFNGKYPSLEFRLWSIHARNHNYTNRDGLKFHLIDVFEKHDDIFQEEDQLFLEMVDNGVHKTNKQLAEEMGVSLRSFYRKNSAIRRISYETDAAATR